VSAAVTEVNSVEDAVEMLQTGRAEAFALSRDSLPPFVAKVRGRASSKARSSKPALRLPCRRSARWRSAIWPHSCRTPSCPASSGAHSTGGSTDLQVAP